MIEKSTTYKESGVDIDAADQFVQKIKPLIRKTETKSVLSSIGHYAGLFELPKNQFKNPVLCASTDGVGTKLKLALEANRLEGLGQDLVAMSANDILCLGAKPLFFLDYIAVEKLHPEKSALLVEGIVNACREIDCTLLGGETAEMPALYQKGDFDLAGFIVGIVEKEKIIDGSQVAPGDLVLGLASSGPHSNGYSLIRKIIEKKNLNLNETFSPLKISLGEALLKPTRLYVNSVLPLVEKLHGIAHITGSGFENIPRIVPNGCRAVIQMKNWPRPPLFEALQNWGNVSLNEMRRVFNLGIGLVLILPEKNLEGVRSSLKQSGEETWVIGRIEKGETKLVYES